MRLQISPQLMFIPIFFIISITSLSSQCVDNHKTLLLQFKSNLKFDSSLSSKLLQWNQKNDCCKWSGVSCDRIGNVIGLDLNSDSINGGIHEQSSLFKLRSLHMLNLAYNNFGSAQIPSALQNLKRLSYLNLSNTNFAGQIPSGFSKLTRLITLDLSSCDLRGVFPRIIFQIPSLRSIDLSNNRILEGSLPEFPQTGSLQNLVLSYTKFSGKIPDSIGNLKMLSRVELRACSFTGKIPNSMSNLTQLLYLDFSVNGLTGSIPSFRLSKKLTLVNFYNNNLTGEISSSYEGLDNLQFLNLANNMISNNVPSYLFTLLSLLFIDLSNNQLSGKINEISIFGSSKVDTLVLSGNQLDGPIPEFFFKLPSLVTLLLSSNNFNGIVELKQFSKLPNLYDLDLSGNKYSVIPSASISNQFGSLRLASCNLQTLPNLKNQTHLMTLDLSKNQIKGEIPSWIWESGNGLLRFLNLSHNLFTNIQEPYTFHRHDFIDLSSNKLHGRIPIPPPSAAYVDYSNNNFSSAVPNDIGNRLSPVFYFFSASNNKLDGIIPQSLCNASRLRVLDLSNNGLSGEIPPCLIKIKTLEELNLKGNKGLCGAPLNKSCNHKTDQVMSSAPLISN